MEGGSPGQLIGRERDVERLREFVEHASRDGAALLVSGDAGVGKSALLEGAAAHAERSGIRLLRATGAEFEANLSFAGLNQLLHPLFEDIDRLRPAHAEALSVSLGLRDGPRSDQLVASNAALELLVRTATQTPVLVVVDDLPWIDRASAAVLAFVARRTSGTRVGFLAALRTGLETFFERAGLPEHQLQPLENTAAVALLDERYPALTSRVRQRLLAEAAGNPLALLELPVTLARGQRATTRPPPALLPLSHRLQSVFASRVTNLPPHTRQLMLLAALDGTGKLAVLETAAATTHADLAHLAPADRAQLIFVNHTAGHLSFRHPLIRSAVVELSSSEDRRHAHELLAACHRDEPARYAWHLAESATGPDEAIAALLQSVAHANLRRGDSVGAITELLRAAELSPARTSRSERLAEAAYLGASVTGDVRSVPELLDEARRADPDGGGALAGAVAGAYQLLNGHGDVDAAHRLLSGAIDALPAPAFDVHNQQLVEALYNLLLVCFFGSRDELWPAFEASLARLEPRPPGLLTTLAETLPDPARTTPAALARLDALIDRLPQETSPARIVRVGNAAFWTGEWDELVAVTEEGLALCDAHAYRLLAWPGTTPTRSTGPASPSRAATCRPSASRSTADAPVVRDAKSTVR